MKLYVNSENNEFELTLNNGQENQLQANGKIHHYDLLDLGFGRYSLILDNRSYKFLHHKNENVHHVQVDNNHFILSLEDEHKRKIKELFKNVHKGPQVQVIKAPIPGLVVKIIAEEGGMVEEGAPLLILEAMKMENIIKAACACRVQEISVKEKETVQLNQPLVKLVKE